MPAAEAAAILLLFLKDPSMWNLPQQKKTVSLFSLFPSLVWETEVQEEARARS